MSLSSIKELWQKIKNPTENPENSELSQNKTTNSQKNSITPEDYRLIFDYMCQKFVETKEIFSKFNAEDFYLFIEDSEFLEYSEKDLIFSKGSPSEDYLFILHGDIDFFDNRPGVSEEKNILIKTISAGKVYGQSIKEKYKYDLRGRTNISILSIKKKTFDDLIIKINKLKNVNKFKFIKKFFPKIRLYSDDIINNVLQNFERVKFNKHSKIFLKDEYNEYIYLIIKGQIAFGLRPKGLFNMDKIDKSLINDDLIEEVNTNLYKNDYILIDKLGRGDVFGISSALKGQKCFYTAVTLTDNVEVYRIVKGNILFYFGGSGGILPIALKALGSLQDNSCKLKKDYLKSIDFTKKEVQSLIKEKFALIFDKDEKLSKNKKIKKDENYFIIDENQIKNNLFEAWKSFENFGSKINEFKSKLLGDKKSTKKKNIFGEEIGEKEDSSKKTKDFGKVSGDATNRVVSRRLNMGLNSNQIKSLDKLNMFCGVNKNGEENIKKVANITSKLEGGARSKLMSFMQNDDGINTLEGFSKRANEKERKMHEKEEKEKKENNEKDKDKDKDKEKTQENKENNEKEKEVQNTEDKKEEIKKENEDNKINNIEIKKDNEVNKEEKNENIENKEKNDNNEKEKEKEKEKVDEKENKSEKEIEKEKENEKEKEKENQNEIKIENEKEKEKEKEKDKQNEIKKENENEKDMEKEKEKGNKPKRPKKGLRALRGLDI